MAIGIDDVMPASSVMCAAFQLCRSNARLLQVFLDIIFIAPPWPPEVSVCLRKYPVKELTWYAGAVHANHMDSPAKLGLYHYGLLYAGAGKARFAQHFKMTLITSHGSAQAG